MIEKAGKALLVAAALIAGAAPVFAESSVVCAIAAPTPSTGNIFYAVAQEAGFFKDEGLSVEFRYTAGGPIATQMVGNGNADVSEVSFEPVAAGYLNGVRGKYVFSGWSKLVYAIGVPEESPVKALADLQGKRLGAITIASASIPIAKSIFKSSGIQVDSSNFVPIGLGASALAALQSGQVAAYAANSYSFAVLARFGMKFRYFEHPRLSRVGNGGFFVSTSLMQNRPKDVSGFMRAIAKSYVFTAANREAAVRMLWKAYPAVRGAGSDEEAMKAAMAELDVALPYFDLNPASGKFGLFDSKAVDEYLQTLREEGVLSGSVTANEILTDQFLSTINEFDRGAVQRIARGWSKS
ncbi:ABC-type nitrate/sulfonate/bicarbonate transport system substrate-binding protein [Bradyrhizobium macuxiense]|uniref:Thiamine pyrimidine synthase n=1 Tax=Bradyrhizobium macuxiense TaxID=1755647 RepID=A0A560KX54_9BRAD|nr:ABC transporter substrate-binding protein [Bradyrhizobium macuxiense]TWB87805.1 ABC-type nitrate/sulfonate/bicarbonate transport system substrate-binding protein [Bradyrhizobium macuxiense]